jgi:hypothetical protein
VKSASSAWQPSLENLVSLATTRVTREAPDSLVGGNQAKPDTRLEARPQKIETED